MYSHTVYMSIITKNWNPHINIIQNHVVNISRILYFYIVEKFHIEFVIIFPWMIISIVYLVFNCLFIQSCHVSNFMNIYHISRVYISYKLYQPCKYHIMYHVINKYHIPYVLHIISHSIYRVIWCVSNNGIM